MSGWDDDDNDGLAVKVADCWEDEGDVPDSWDAEPEQATLPAKAPPPKLTLKEKIRLREEAKRKEIEEKLKQQAEDNANEQMSELQRQRRAEEAELDLLADTFGDTSVKPKATTNGIDDLCPSTKEEFTRLNELLKDKFTKLESSPYFTYFAEQAIKDISVGMELESLKSISTAINALIIEKQKIVKTTKGKKKPKAKNLKVERDDDFAYQEGGDHKDDYDDFI